MRINFNVTRWPLSSIDRLVVVIKWRKIPVNVTLNFERKVEYKCSGLPIYCISNRRNDVVTQVQLYHSKDTNYSNCVIYSMMSWWIDITDIFYPLTPPPLINLPSNPHFETWDFCIDSGENTVSLPSSTANGPIDQI